MSITHPPPTALAHSRPATDPLPTGPGGPGSLEGACIKSTERSAGLLAQAAMALDTHTMTRITRTSIIDRGVVFTWDQVIGPVLRGLGSVPCDGQAIAVERLLNRTLFEVLAAVPRPRLASSAAVGALLACAEEEHHTLALEAVAAALAEAGESCCFLGPRTPSQALTAAIGRLHPAAVLLWSQTPATAGPAQVRVLLTVRPRPQVIAVTGPGWDPATIPATIARPGDLTATLTLIRSAVAART